MTVGTRGSPCESLDRLAGGAAPDMGAPRWWASLAHDLGELGEELARTDTAGLAAQIITDAPHFAAAAGRLRPIHEQAQRDVARLRRVAGEPSRSTAAAREVCDAVEVLLRRVRTLHRLSNSLMLDAYGRDLGGE
jgi:hypothetical protein